MHEGLFSVGSWHRKFFFVVVGDSENVSSCIELQVWVNQYNLLCNNVPFGGKKQSGIGKSRVGQSQYRGSRH